MLAEGAPAVFGCKFRSVSAICGGTAKEQFFHAQTPALFKKLEELSQRSGVSRGQAFEDWLMAIVCALAAETKEAEYLAMVERHTRGKPGERGVDLMGQMFGELVLAMDDNDGDILGDLFQGSVTYGDAGQYSSPECVARLMAEMSVDPDARPEPDRPLLINDPCCGTGRMLLEAANVNPHAELVGQDIDARCAKVTAINLGLRGRYGWVVCGKSLSAETQFAYRVGSFFNETTQGLRRGVIRDVPPEQTPVAVIAKRTRDNAAELFLQENDEQEVKASEAGAWPTILEIPRWLARLEPALATVEAASRTGTHDAQPAAYDVPADPEPLPDRELDEAHTQRTLF